MDFNSLMAKMRELDQPVGETVVPECGEPMGMNAPMGMTPPGMPPKPDVPPPSMSVNLNAQGLDNIKDMLDLWMKVNPDMMSKDADPISAMPPAISIDPMDKPAGLPPLGGLGDLDKGPLKMLPDLDADEPSDNGPGPDMMNKPDDSDDGVSKAQGDLDNDGDHDMDDHDAEKDKDKEEAFANSVGDSEPEAMGVDAAVHDGNDLNKSKKSFSGKPYRGDNPMAAGAYESIDVLRSSIRAELLQRLAEAKGAK